MMNLTTKRDSLQPAAEMAVDLFDNWFDPIETEVRARSRQFIEELAVIIELYNWYSRYEHGTAAIIPTGLILSLIVVLILLFTGWKGWEMVYRHHVGVSDEPPPMVR